MFYPKSTQLLKISLVGCAALVSHLDFCAAANRDQKLFEAARNGQEELVRRLLDQGANVNASGDGLYSPLHDAILNDHKKIVRLLLDDGAPPNQAGMVGATPSYRVAQYNYAAIVQLLLNHEVDPNLANINGHTALDRARGSSPRGFIQWLICRVLYWTKNVDDNQTVANLLQQDRT